MGSHGREFGALLRADLEKMNDHHYVPPGVKGIKFSMLRQQHFEKAAAIFGTEDIDRLFVVHAIDQRVLEEFSDMLAMRRIYWLTIPDVVRDLVAWYRTLERPAALRATLVGDLIHLLIGFCAMDVQWETTIPGQRNP